VNTRKGTSIGGKQHTVNTQDLIKIVDLLGETKEKFDCVLVASSILPKPVRMCCYNSSEDRYISGAIRHGHLFEEKQGMRLMVNLLRSDAEYGFIDIGANIGTYTVVAAAHARKVVAVEPTNAHVIRLRKSLQLAGLTSNVTLIQNGISNTYKTFYNYIGKHNRGDSVLSEDSTRCNKSSGYICAQGVQTIHLDDLLPHISFKKAVMKVDVECFEPQVFVPYSEELLKVLYIPLIIMEWSQGCLNPKGGRERYTSLAEYLVKHKYKPTKMNGELLNLKVIIKWPMDVVWRLQT
jgi:FkbM family methyltransferase